MDPISVKNKVAMEPNIKNWPLIELLLSSGVAISTMKDVINVSATIRVIHA